MSQISVICFDLDDTLWAIEPVIQHAEAKLQAWFEQHYPKLAALGTTHMQRLRDSAAERHPQLAHDLAALRKASLADAATAVGYSADLVEPAFDIFIAARHEVELFPDVLPMLEKLAQHYVLCALTNGNADVQRVGLGHVFSMALTARQLGVAKPHPQAFTAVSEQLNVVPQAVMHVGDDAICDVQGALQAGMKAVWINRKQQTWTANEQPHAIINTLWELEALLAQY